MSPDSACAERPDRETSSEVGISGPSEASPKAAIDAKLASIRAHIDNIDSALVFLLAERFKVTQQVGLLKVIHRLPPADLSREAQQIAMWIGRGLWFDMDIYSVRARVRRRLRLVDVPRDRRGRLPRYGDDPMRALAARFTGFTDQLYMPGWAEEWCVKEGQAHSVDGVVHLVADDVPGAHFTIEALGEAGIPILEVRANNSDPHSVDPAVFSAAIADFLNTRVAAPSSKAVI